MSVTSTFTEEQSELRQTLRRFLEDTSSSAEVRRVMETDEGYDAVAWSQLAEIGLPGLIVPDDLGGFGGSYTDLAVALEEMGRSLFCGPFFATVALAANTLLSSGDADAGRDLLPGIASGETLATLAFTEDDGGWDPAGATTRATSSGGTWTLDGRKSFVIDGLIADLILVTADTQHGLSLFAVQADAAGLDRAPLPAMDPTRKLARVELSATPARAIGEPGNALPGLARALDLAGIALAAEQVGGARRCVEMSSEYAAARVQFDRPIGSFQAIKHKCANMLVEVESARAAAYYAAAAVAEDAPELPVAASLAQAVCSEAYSGAAAENIQIHGGIGFTWEHDSHLHFKRAKASELMFGDAIHHRQALARRMRLSGS